MVASHPVLREHEVVTGADRPVATIEGTLLCGLSVSPDGEAIIYGCSDWGTSDVLMIEDFR